MALCGFRADNFRFGMPGGEGLSQVLSLLVKLSDGFSRDEAGKAEAVLLDGLERSGLLFHRDGKAYLTPEGETLLQTCRGLSLVPSAP